MFPFLQEAALEQHTSFPFYVVMAIMPKYYAQNDNGDSILETSRQGITTLKWGNEMPQEFKVINNVKNYIIN